MVDVSRHRYQGDPLLGAEAFGTRGSNLSLIIKRLI